MATPTTTVKDLNAIDAGATLLFGVDPIDPTKANAVTVDTNGFVQMTPNAGLATSGTQRVTCGGPAPGQAAKVYTGTITLTGLTQIVPLETVGTGRTYYATDIIITTTNAAAILVQLASNGIPSLMQAHVNSTKGIEALGIETQPTATTGQVVSIIVPQGAGVVAYSIYGIEQ